MNNPNDATQTKERLYTQLVGSMTRMTRAIGQTADLCEQLQLDLHAMRIFAGIDAAKLMTVASNVNQGGGGGGGDEGDSIMSADN
ncbi:hypothetical protein FISHEDRAFT_69589 [Fistulina hepatica ATCC 64428]|uniref:Uncharacterized protein n=1 Tax=Fistulina hepatica ATCC 64428 TaxID=1128425 RepID=A0A0D7APR6_9AGAR|nr:hypothetical protein FISHEDRAFT_69589 [Fistulina hepatica ATCC 64428]